MFIHDILQSRIVISITIVTFFKESSINIYFWYQCANHLHGYAVIPAMFEMSASELLLPSNMCFSLTNLKPTEVALFPNTVVR